MKLRKLVITATVLVSVMLSAIAYASPSASILYNEQDLGNGSYQYDYIFNNTSTTGESLFKVFFYFDQLSETTGSPLPTGWVGTVWTGTNTNTFLNTMALNQNYYIAPGDSLGGFSFTIDYQLGNSDFIAEFKNDQGTKFAFSGTTSPVAPEPVSTVLFLIGGATLGVRTYLKRMK
ncbi:MAG: hypothetical protein C4560_11810 [Nitrospiraceae bacterium]|nr:MAG: hypothetical protein C4560_11810 [Nitrospiraceae bacterium]